MEDLSFFDYLTIIKRRRRYFFITASLVLMLTVVAAMHWSNYRSYATVEIEDAQIPEGITIPAGMSNSAGSFDMDTSAAWVGMAPNRVGSAMPRRINSSMLAASSLAPRSARLPGAFMTVSGRLG